ncbi:hypothetical protein [Streptomyces aidingensis]|uniref:Secreted protein n=1 Tax=Streptomyces aidingensis TaxID=910347 RepID=A0A1I1FHZ7_9ACTN|nr:hypothetical protein [Streptomyces aidingensis]SFB98911.1 hypothetical protein SAMN05421773_101743 [Streptomyces aidingensis]
MVRAGRGTAVAALAVAGVLALAGCARNDRSEIVTFTDEHGRVCTGAVVIDGDDGDREMAALDCEYPPEGVEPGPSTAVPVP